MEEKSRNDLPFITGSGPLRPDYTCFAPLLHHNFLPAGGLTGDGLVRQLRWNECAASWIQCRYRPGL